MTDREINAATINDFLARAINRAAVTAVDSEFGLRVQTAAVTESGHIRVDLEGGNVILVVATHCIVGPQRREMFDAVYHVKGSNGCNTTA